MKEKTRYEIYRLYAAATGGGAAPIGAGAPWSAFGSHKHGAQRTPATRGGDVRRRAALKIKSFAAMWLILLTGCRPDNVQPVEVAFRQPPHFPQPVYDLNSNPITSAGFELGRRLFYDPILSRDGTISCSFCHIQVAAFTQHGHDLSHGIDDKETMRNSLPIQNLAWERHFMWDGGVFHLDLFAIAPIEDENEMDETLPNVLNKLRHHDEYPFLFEAAFGTPEITTTRFLKALSQFQLMCISDESDFDRYVRDGRPLPPLAQQGLQIFESKCAGCHAGVLQTDNTFRHNGLPIKNASDTGRERITLNPADAYLFKVPSLRNVERTYPYMHDGRFQTLREVLDHYSSGVVDHPNLDPLLKQNGQLGIPLTESDKDAIEAFLKTLTDLRFINNKMLSEFF